MKEVAGGVYLSVAALLVANHHEGHAVDGTNAADHGGVVQPRAVPVELHKLVCDVEGDVQECGPVGVARHLQLLDRCQPVVRI